MKATVQGRTLFFYHPRQHALLVALVAFEAIFLSALTGCHSVPVTGRKRILLVSEPAEIAMGLEAYEQTLAGAQPSTNPHLTDMVQRVGDRLAEVAQRPDYDWEFRLINSPEQNAFCLPGGKVAIYEGILPVCHNEAGLAVVMSHEVAHALARHGAERMTHDYVVNGVGTVLSTVTQMQDEVVRDRLLRGYGVASKYGFVLPYSRKHESEADQMGLLLMASAGYDPAEAPEFWRRFGEAKSGESTAEFLSTHPNDARRAADLLTQLESASQLYADAPQRLGRGEPIAFRVASQTVAESPAGL